MNKFWSKKIEKIIEVRKKFGLSPCFTEEEFKACTNNKI